MGGLDLYVSANVGAATPTWTKKSVWSNAVTASNYVHADHHTIVFIPAATGSADKA